jgi:hypothetical protein
VSGHEEEEGGARVHVVGLMGCYLGFIVRLLKKLPEDEDI